MNSSKGIKPEYYEEMVTSANDGLLLVEGETIVGCNPAACKLYGLTEEELLQTHPAQLSPEFQPSGISSKEAANKYIKLARAGIPQRFIWQHLRKNEGEFTCEVTLNPARVDDKNNVSGFVTLLRDVTEKQKAEHLLKTSELRFRNLFNGSPVAMLLVKNGEIIASNKAFSNMLNFPKEVPINFERMNQLFFQQNDFCFQQLIEKHAMEEFTHLADDFKLIEGIANTSHVQISLAKISDETVISFHDTSVQRRARDTLENINKLLEEEVTKRTEKLEQALLSLQAAQTELVRSERLASLGALVAGVAHELNTPIGVALTASSLTKDRVLALETTLKNGLSKQYLTEYIQVTKESSSMIETNLQRAAQLITNFKQVVVEESAHSKSRFYFNDLLNNTITSIKEEFERNNVSLKKNIAHHIEMESYYEPLSQVLLQLLSNSLKHAFNHQHNAEIQICVSQLSSESIQIIVKDNGVGIDKGKLEKIFDPFFTSQLGKGQSGLGLHIVYSTVKKLLNGEIEVYSDKGSGVEFKLLLPITV